MTTSQPTKDIRDAFFDEIYELGKKNKDLIFISDDMDAFGLRHFKKDFPDQFINIGVAEQNMIDVAAGLAACGKRVFVYGICSYVTMRCFEQIKFSLCSMKLPVVIVGVGAGFSFSFDGPTHHGTQDIAIMRALPEIEILNPGDAASAAASAQLAYQSSIPVYIRLDKGVFPELYKNKDSFSSGFKIVKPLQKINILSTGFMSNQALQASKILSESGLEIGVVDVLRLKPLSQELVDQVLKQSEVVITLEEHSVVGGLGGAVGELIQENQLACIQKKIAVPDVQYLAYGSRDWFHEKTGIDLQSICETVKKC
ncbi:MAG: hypothetical protein KGZ30_01495 [Anaplasmataceae bacterium]|nr:hypothetical protein [Anaplasmataceae bacterium]